MTLWHDSGIPQALALANARMATDACAKSPTSATDAEMALLNLKMKIEAYFGSKGDERWCLICLKRMPGLHEPGCKNGKVR